MDQILAMFSNPAIIIAIVAAVLLLVVLLISKKMKMKKLKRTFDELNIEYNSLKSVPLSFKMNKAVAIAKVNQDTLDVLNQCKGDYEKIQTNFEQLSRIMAETDDNITVRKAKLIKENLLDLQNYIDIGKTQVDKLDVALDSILERENEQRAEVTELKERFREVKTNILENSNVYTISFETLESKITDLEKLFSIFEEWIYASEFNKTKDVLQDIEVNIATLCEVSEKLPELIKNARGLIPSIMDEMKREYALSVQKNVFLSHVEFEKNMDAITETLKLDLAHIEKCEVDTVSEDLNAIEVRLQQLQEQLTTEENAFYEVKQYMKADQEEFDKIAQSIEYIKSVFPRVESKFGLEGIKDEIKTHQKRFGELVKENSKIHMEIEKQKSPASNVLISIRELVKDMDILGKYLISLKEKLNQACIDEERAKKQLLKLQLITNEMEVKIVKNKLPSISSSFHEDLKKANNLIEDIKFLIDEVPLNIKQLNHQLNETIDFVYKLYNSVNKVVGMALMVENTVVFANKYRSSYPDVDSELTRAELCYRNGEYTQALEIAVSAVEKMFPNSYGKLIKENALSAR